MNDNLYLMRLIVLFVIHEYVSLMSNWMNMMTYVQDITAICGNQRNIDRSMWKMKFSWIEAYGHNEFPVDSEEAIGCDENVKIIHFSENLKFGILDATIEGWDKKDVFENFTESSFLETHEIELKAIIVSMICNVHTYLHKKLVAAVDQLNGEYE